MGLFIGFWTPVYSLKPSEWLSAISLLQEHIPNMFPITRENQKHFQYTSIALLSILRFKREIEQKSSLSYFREEAEEPFYIVLPRECFDIVITLIEKKLS